MHGLVNKAIQNFLMDIYGSEMWAEIGLHANLPFADFEAMLIYDAGLTRDVVVAACDLLKKRPTALLEDLGTYLVSHPNCEGLRRLLRFAGVTFEDFLYSLDDLPDRARLAVADLDIPAMELLEQGAGQYRIRCREPFPGVSFVLIGVLRAMADDYGALVVLERIGIADGVAEIDVKMVEQAFAEGRQFDLGASLG
ncbi:heme NO-binding domain-containing protein [Pseudooceanicola aestuarii]|uniref:heme NO-binding domain-containing protein n=1 Tax=Pseudooceanicola aestuarii TaxID=2697319 RepID=UPI0013D4C393|nr:heme NO-binding domain-containing protein [Pseudooceanicola aestuarii]